MTGVRDLGTVLGVWAHPDDEAYLSAGLMASAVRAGQRVVVVTATAGERGTPDPEHWPPERMARRRRLEMAASLAALGVREHHWLGYPDGGCEDVADDVAVAELARIIATVQPDTIVTFGPDGMTGHPDHRTVSAWATRAWREHRPSARLWYATVLPEFHHRWAHVNTALGIFPDDTEAPCTPEDEAAGVLRCDDHLLDVKLAALHAHASQTGPVVEIIGEEAFRTWWTLEVFADAARMASGSRA